MKKILVIGLGVFFILIVAYEAITIIDKYMTVGRMWETPAVRPHEKELHLMEAGVVPFEGGEAFFRAIKGEDLNSPLEKGDKTNIKLGGSLYSTYCAQCHGKYHDGNGTVGQGFYPLPTDLKSPKVQSQPEGVIFKVISYGIDKPDNRQPPLATTIDVLDRWRIATYVKSLGLRK